MSVKIKPIGARGLRRYGEIPMHFRVESVLRAVQVDDGLGGLRLVEERLDEPYVKDYDGLHGEGPTRWARRFDVSNWGFFLASDGRRRVGGAVLAHRSPNVTMLDGRTDLAVLWDLRVDPEYQRSGVGTALFQHAVAWARAKGCKQLKIETQDVNAPACRFYARQGCHLGAIDRYGYAGDPRVAHETMLLWYLDL